MRKRFLGISLSIGVALAGCSSIVPLVPRPTDVPVTQAAYGKGDLLLSLRMNGSVSTQGTIPVYDSTSIARLEIVPFVEVSAGSFDPLSQSGGVTTDGAADQLKLSMSGASLDLDRIYTFSNLAPNRTYRVYARAFDAQDVSISTDAESYVTLTVDDERPTMGDLPLRMSDRVFSTATTAEISFTGNTGSTEDVLISLVKLRGITETAIPGATASVSLGDLPRTFTLGNLGPNTRYRLKAQPRNAAKTVLTTSSLEWGVTDDTTVAPGSLTLRLDPNYVTTYAGTTNGYLDGTRETAQFKNPYDVIYDAQGNLFVSDYGDHRIRKITPAGAVSTWVGSGSMGNVPGKGTAATISRPLGMVFDSHGDMFVISYGGGHNIWKITPDGQAEIFAGSTTGQSGSADGTGTAARFYHPIGLAIDSADNLYVADNGNHLIRKITPNKVVTTLAGSTPGYADGTGTAAQFSGPFGICVAGNGDLYVADSNNRRIRKVTPDGVVTTFTGTGAGGFGDGSADSATFASPRYVTISSYGTLFLTDSNMLRKVAPDGTVTTIAGSTLSGSEDGLASAARFSSPYGLKALADDTLVVADFGNSRIRRVIYP